MISSDIIVGKAISSVQDGGLEIKDRKYMFKNYSTCFVGSEFVDWLTSEGFASDMDEAVKIG